MAATRRNSSIAGSSCGKHRDPQWVVDLRGRSQREQRDGRQSGAVQPCFSWSGTHVILFQNGGEENNQKEHFLQMFIVFGYRLVYQMFFGDLLCAWHWGYGANKTKSLLSSNGGRGQAINNK